MARTKRRTVCGLTADDDGLVVAAAIAATGVDADGLALSQAIDVAADTDNLAALQNPNNALDVNDFVAATAYTAATPLTLLAAAATISPARRVSFVSGDNLSATNFTLVGTGVNSVGAAVTGEVIVGPNATTVNTVNAYSAITSITPDATSGANTVSVGWPAYLGLGLTLEALAASLIPARNVSLTSGAAADFSNVTFTVTGTGNDGQALAVTLVGPNNTTVSTTGFFSSVTSIRPNRTAVSVSANISAGYPANAVPQPMTLDGVLGNGAGVVSDTFAASKVTLTSTDNQSGRTFTIVGIGTNGLSQSEVLTGPNNTTVTSAKVYTAVTSVTPDDDGAGALSVGLAGNFGTLTLVSGTMDPPRRLTFDSNGNIATINFTVVGTDRFGNAISEVITGVTTTPITSTKVYATVTSITPDAATASTIFVGWTAEVFSAPLMLNHYNNPFNAGIGVVVTGTVNYTVQHTFDDLQAAGTTDGSGTWFDHDDLAAQTANADGNYAYAVEAVRIVLNSGSGCATMSLIQSGL